MPPSDRVRLQHMLEAAREGLAFCAGLTRDGIRQNRVLAFALAKCIEMVGEAAVKVTPETRRQVSGIPWTDVVGMRNRLIHVYFDIDWDVVLDTVLKDFPGLITSLERIVLPVIAPASDHPPESLAKITEFIDRFGEVDPATLALNLPEALFVAAILDGERVLAAGAIKKLGAHHESIKRQSGYSDLDHYAGELGYIAVDAEYREVGLGKIIVASLCRRALGPLYATTRLTNEAMHRILTRNGFQQLGKSWESRQHPGESIILWVQPRSAL